VRFNVSLLQQLKQPLLPFCGAGEDGLETTVEFAGLMQRKIKDKSKKTKG